MWGQNMLDVLECRTPNTLPSNWDNHRVSVRKTASGPMSRSQRENTKTAPGDITGSTEGIYSFQSLHDAKYVMRSLRSPFFLSPANTILVPGIIFLGFFKYVFNVFLSHVNPELRLADEYENDPMVPASRPTIPYKLGPCPLAPPFSVLWH